MGIPDPCGKVKGYEHIIAIYLKFLMLVVNLRHIKCLHSATVSGYANTINILFQLQGFDLPGKLSDPNNMPGILINNLCIEEDIACQCSTLDNTIFAKLHWAAKASHLAYSKQKNTF
jgi:hypothetical protein